MTIDIRPVREAELPAYIDALSTAFLDRPDVDRAAQELRTIWDLDRCWGAFDDGRVCGTYRSWPTELTLPGGARVPAAAVSAVTVLPTHRRRGILRRMTQVGHAAARERGEAASVLHASEYPIYGRFGYGMGTREATWALDTARLTFHGEPSGTIELVRPDTGVRDAIKAVFEAWRHRQPGEIARRETNWDFALGLRAEFWGPPWKGFVALHRDATGAIDGYARYHAEEKWEDRQPRGTLEVDELYGLTETATATLWRFLAETDWVARLKAERRSPSDRLPWLVTNGRAARILEQGDSIWVRIFDVPRTLAARTYERTGHLVLEVIDPEAVDGRWRVELDAGPDGATCVPTTREPDLTVDIAALGAAWLGGTRLRDAVIAAGVDEHATGALGRADALLRTADEPWCSTFF